MSKTEKNGELQRVLRGMTDRERINEVQDFIDVHTTDGNHHAQWVVDQVLRILMPEERYLSWVASREAGGYDWDEGTPP